MSEAVLIVDDSLTVRMDLGDSFQAAGFAPALTETIAGARAALKAKAPALLVLDVHLPDGDGVELLKEIRGDAAMKHLPIMLLSTRDEVASRIRGLSTGADEYVGKPYDADYVVARGGELIRKHAAPAPRGDARAVLVIDDSLTFRMTLEEALKAAGYAVLSAATGEEGIRLAHAHRPTAAIVDRVLPGLDGPAVVRRFRADAAFRQMPCILLTASGSTQEEVGGLDAGADAYVRKGEDVAVVLARLASLLRSTPERPIGPDSALGTKKVLAVDDSTTFLFETRDRLMEAGYAVVAASSGEEALRLLEVERVDCILLDMVMPGLSGIEVCRRLKESARWRDVPLIMLTGRDDPESMIQGLGAGADDYVSKSSEPEVLLGRLRAQLRRQQVQEENRRMQEEILRKELEARLAHQERLASIGTLAGGVAHEINNPLAFIKGNLEFLTQELAALKEVAALTGDAAQRLEEMEEALADSLGGAKRVCRIVKQLHVFAQGDPVESELVDVKGVLDRALAGVKPEAAGKARLVSEVGEVAAVPGNTAHLKQVFHNLLVNAVQAFPSPAESNQVTVRGWSEADGSAVVEVSDNGPGIAPEVLKKMFEPFFTTKPVGEGVGLGLSVCHGIVIGLGGRITAASEPGRGTSLRIVLPGKASHADGRALKARSYKA